MPADDPADTWFQTRPAAIQELLIAFPPVCRVEALRPLGIPGPGRVGRVTSYFEDGKIGVEDEAAWLTDDPKRVRAQCETSWLRVIQYDGNKTPDWDAAQKLVGMDTPWPLPDVLRTLAEATEHLLDVHGCDAHGYETYRIAALAARSFLKALDEPS